MTQMREAAAARMAGGVRAVTDRPQQRRSAADVDAPRAPRGGEVRAKGDPAGGSHVVGVASVTERAYEMWDAFGPYMEVVSADAFDRTLEDDPIVEYVLNHGRNGGAPMASTRNGTLVLTVTKDGENPGLGFDAEVDRTRTDVSDHWKALERRDSTDASFRFRIVSGQWSPDYTEYRIEEVDMDGGDVSSVNIGASPHAFSGVREDTRQATGPAPRTGRGIVRSDDLRGYRGL